MDPTILRAYYGQYLPRTQEHNHIGRDIMTMTVIPKIITNLRLITIEHTFNVNRYTQYTKCHIPRKTNFSDDEYRFWEKLQRISRWEPWPKGDEIPSPGLLYDDLITTWQQDDHRALIWRESPMDGRTRRTKAFAIVVRQTWRNRLHDLDQFFAVIYDVAFHVASGALHVNGPGAGSSFFRFNYGTGSVAPRSYGGSVKRR